MQLNLYIQAGAYAEHRLTYEQTEELDKLLEPIIKRHTAKHQLAGSYRRGHKEVGDADYIVTDADLTDLFHDLAKKFRNIKLARGGDKLITCVVPFKKKEIQVEFINVPKSSFGAALLHSTGSGDFNHGLRSFAKKKGFKLNQYGLFDVATNKKIAGTTEESIFKALDLKPIPPTDRDNDFWSVRTKYKAPIVVGATKR